MIVDTHCHVSSRWYEPVESLLSAMDRNGVDRAVMIQPLGSTDYGDMLAAARRHADRLRFVATVDPTRPDWADAVTHASGEGACGLRCRAGWRSPGDDPFAYWRLLEAQRLVVSMVGPVASFTDGSVSAIAAECPTLPLVLEHLGGLARPDAGDRDAALPPLFALADIATVSLKLPGLGQLAPRLPSIDGQDIPLDLTGVSDLLIAVLDRFGAGRLMWGSDFPPVSAREGYGNALIWTRDLVARHRPEAVAPVFGGNAAASWGY